MSDFDKEAEREKLRKKFARDEEKRAETQRMSELLLKGATMTNKHCSQCSDPLFRYNGQTFCPSCQAADAEADSAQPPTESVQESSPDHESSAEPTEHTEPTANPPQSVESTVSHTPQSSKTNPAASQPSAGQLPAGQPREETPSSQYSPSTDPQTEGLAAARQSLERTITRFARRAEKTEDPRRARELLSAAHEAAATLSELE